MKKSITIIFFLLISTTIFSQENFVEYKKDNFSISYPENWRLDTSGQMNTTFIIYSPTQPEDPFHENINLLIQDLTGQNLDLESYTSISENQIKTMIPNTKLVKSERKGNYHEVIWSGFVANNNLKFKQIYYVINDKAFVLTFTALDTTFDDYIDLGSKILDTFKLN